ncbi:MAG: hypothetical protein ACKO2Z_08395 [Sphaerospermopsis kisseleviana]
MTTLNHRVSSAPGFKCAGFRLRRVSTTLNHRVLTVPRGDRLSATVLGRSPLSMIEISDYIE